MQILSVNTVALRRKNKKGRFCLREHSEVSSQIPYFFFKAAAGAVFGWHLAIMPISSCINLLKYTTLKVLTILLLASLTTQLRRVLRIK